jgi:hypothetical protein
VILATLAGMIMNFPAIDPARTRSFDPHGGACIAAYKSL